MMVVLAWRPTAESPISGEVLATMNTMAAVSVSASVRSSESVGLSSEGVAAARTTRLTPGRECRQTLQQIAIGAGDGFHRWLAAALNKERKKLKKSFTAFASNF